MLNIAATVMLLTLTVCHPATDEPQVSASGVWIDRSRDDYWEAGLVEAGGQAAVSVGCWQDRPAKLRFDYELSPDGNVGHAVWERWGFFTADGGPVLTGDRPRPEMSADLAAALVDAQVLIVDVFARAEPFPNAGAVYSDEGFRWEGESEWRQEPHVFPLRWVFDLAGAEGQGILLDVLDRCG